MRLNLLVFGVLAFFGSIQPLTAQDAGAEFKSIFDGKSLSGWKANENPDSWKVEDGTLTCKGPRSHLFYVGDEKPFKNFHFK
ncbi:MAG: family 16 glycoside hydrolase, partial [Pirellulaceae bacterium]